MSNNSAVDLMVGNRPLSSLRVVDLKQELEKRGLSKSGTKKDLADRLRLNLQIEKHRDSAPADEEELPNYSVHEELADQNPFIRDYLASQAELYHSQKVVKKLVEEEAKRESETSADEGVESPVKQQPPPPVLEREESPVAVARRQSRRRTDSQREEVTMTAEKLVTRSSRSRSPAAATAPEASENNVQVQNPNEQPKTLGTAAPLEKEKPPELAAPSPEPESAKIPIKTVKLPDAEPPQRISESPEPPQKVQKEPEPEPPAPAKVLEEPKAEEKTKTKICNEEEKMETEVSPKKAEGSDKHTTPAPEIPKDTPEVTKKPSSPEPEPAVEAIIPKVVVAQEKTAVEETKKDELEVEENNGKLAVEAMEIDEDAEKNKANRKSRSRSSSPIVEKVADAPRKREPSPKKQDSNLKDESGSSSDEIRDDDDSSSRSEDRSKSRSRSRSKSKSRSRSRSVDSRASKEDSGDEDSAPEKKSEVGDDEESREEGEAATMTPVEVEVRRSKSRSASRSPAREISAEQADSKMEEKGREEPESDSKPEEPPAKTEEKKETKSALATKAFVDLAGEEALDYGEEEEDEDRADPEFAFTRRNLKFKNKGVLAPAPPASQWTLEMDTRFLVVKSKLLNKLYEDIKLIPLEQLKLEEKSAEASEDKGKPDLDRKASISREFDQDEPLPTRTVENVQPVFTRTVSIVPASKTKLEASVEGDDDKPLSPPRNPQSDVLLITNLTRPFTLPQLKEMLQRTGTLVDIWVDKIKSKCIAKFDSQEEAFETRAALHGVRWPSSNPKSLHVDYSTQDNLDDHKAKENGEQNPVSEKPTTAQAVPVREWDMGKKTEPKSPGRNRKRSRSPSAGRDRDRGKRSRRTPSPGRKRHSRSPTNERRGRAGEGKEPEPMGKALDELFKKTIAAPSIYWLPLTAEQIAEKEELRRKRMLERERRLAELSKIRPR